MTDQPRQADRPVTLADEAALDAFVASNDVALVMFRTAGCSICDSMKPVLGNVARATDAAVATINPRDDPPLIDRFNVRSTPTLVLFRDGEQVERRAGEFVPTADLVDLVERTGSRPQS